MPTRYSNDQNARRLSENELYARVYEEIESGQMDKAAQARAIVEGGGADGAVKSAYIKHRIENIKAEIEIALELAEREHEKLKQKQEEEELSERRKLEERLRKGAGKEREEAQIKKYLRENNEKSGNPIKLILVLVILFVVVLLVSL